MSVKKGFTPFPLQKNRQKLKKSKNIQKMSDWLGGNNLDKKDIDDAGWILIK